ncbi:hypothetical protein FisN_24Hh118 [Fistulifera solaris]|uniref:Uncharacterized protein n=1 Tax=Fistulifera solaris TaxID=1519565 RepID=A0A1Z5JF74_FISSO|nr:hypothetical protein FisN_24Hh118 [Fistulifera solaris]|eukprot:GAX12542.1 hypothetical protein FisN_24Hh118 [Fistulifera solaris]
MINYVWKAAFLILWSAPVSSFAPNLWGVGHRSLTTTLGLFDKLFEEEGPLGKGITVGKVQVALIASDRGKGSIFGQLEELSRESNEDQEELAYLARDVCLALLRRSDDWTAAHSESKWFKYDDAGKAESQFNDWANAEALKFEKEYIPSEDDEEKGTSTMVVVSLIIEIEGDETKFDGAGFSLAGTKEVLTSIASDVMVAEGEVVNAVELFWTPTVVTISQKRVHDISLSLFNKLFEEEGVLGKGITVGKVQVALFSKERGKDSIFGDLERKARSTGGSSAHLAILVKEVCLALLRRSDDWIAASSDSQWFPFRESAKAEAQFNQWAEAEALKFEKEYIPGIDTEDKGTSTMVVVSLIVEIEGDSTRFDGAGFSMEATRQVLTSLASNAVVAEGEVVSAAEVLWTPSARDETLTSRDLMADFPTLITL